MPGCRSYNHIQAPAKVVPTGLLTPLERAGAKHHDELLKRAGKARHRATCSEQSGLSNCVDEYYESAVYAYGAMCRGGGTLAGDMAAEVYNQSLADCLRTATCFGRFSAGPRILIHGPRGSFEVPVAPRGFVWKSSDFDEFVDPRRIPTGRRRRTGPLHMREGLGATQVIIRHNPHEDASDRWMGPKSFFAATAVLRPDLDAWLGEGGALGSSTADVMEFYDPIRIRCVDVAGRPTPLAWDLEAPVDLAEEAVESNRYTLEGFINPSQEIANARLGWSEPYQPGKVVVVFVHGLLDNPYNFREIVNDLRERPGFAERYQVAFYRYPTGNSFLRSAAIFRRQLREAEATFDPTRTDPGFQNMVVVGYSMGGLISKLQVTSSGDHIWNLLSSRPIEQIVTAEGSRAFLRQLTYFEPTPFVRRVVYLATPHDGSTYASNLLGRFARSLVQRPADTLALTAQLDRDNPGVFTRFGSNLPTSIDLLGVDNPLLAAMMKLPVNPSTPYHTILGVGYLPDDCNQGDGIVPRWSASIPGASSEHHVAAVHTNITHNRDASREIQRILRLHLDDPSTSPAR